MKIINEDKKGQRIILILLCAFVAISIAAMLIISGNAETEPLCGMEEHAHSQECFIIYEGDEGMGYATATSLKTGEVVYISEEPLCGREKHEHDGTCYLSEGPEDFNIEEGESEESEAPPILFAAMEAELADYSSNLWDFVNDVVIRDSKGVQVYPPPFGTGQAYTGEKYTFEISFSEKYQSFDNLQFEYAGGFLTYQLPSGIVPADEVFGAFILDSSNNPMGIYSINYSGYMTVYLGDYIDIDSWENVSFVLYIEAIFTSTGNDISFDFGDDVSINIDISEPEVHLNVEKKASTYDPFTKTIDYEITITAIGGDIENITAHDQAILTDLSETALWWLFCEDLETALGHEYFKNSSIAWQTDDPSWVTASGVYATTPWNSSASQPPFYNDLYGNTDLHGDLYLDFTGDVLHKGKSITITYTLEVSDFIDMQVAYNGENPAKFDFGFIRNYVIADGDEYGGAPLESAEAKTMTPLFRDLIAKNSYTMSIGTGIGWNVTHIGDGFSLLNNSTIYDTMGRNEGLMSNEIVFDMELGFMIYGKPTLISGGGIIWPTPVLVTESQMTAGGWIVFNADRSAYTLTMPSPTDIIPGTLQTFGEIYLITFCTWNGGEIQTPVYGPQDIYWNELRIEFPGDSNVYKYRRDHSLIVGIGMSKSNTITPTGIEYEITAEIPAGMMGESIYFSDFPFLTPNLFESIDYWLDMVDTSYIISNLGISVSIDSIAPGEPLFKYTIRSGGINAVNNDSCIMILFGSDNLPTTGTDPATTLAMSSWQYDTPKTLTITFTLPYSVMLGTIYGDMPFGVLPSMTLGEFFDAHPEYRLLNVGYLYNYGMSNMNMVNAWTTAAKPISKTGVKNSQDSSVVDYTVYVNPAHAFQIFSEGEALFIDEFDGNKLEYVPKSLYVAIAGHYVAPYTAGSIGTISDPGAIEDAYNASTNPDGALKIETGKITVDFDKIKQELTWGGNIGSSTISGTPPSDWYTGADYVYKVHYQLRIKTESTLLDAGGTIALADTASVITTGLTDRRYITGKFNDSFVAGYGNKLVNKWMDYDGNVAEASIIINPEGKRLLPPPSPFVPPTPAFIEAVDKMSNSLSFYLGTIKLWSLLPGKTWADVNDPAAWEEYVGDWNYQVTGSDGEYTEVNFLLPDQMALKITYSALIKGNVGDTVHVENLVSVDGKYFDSYYGSFVIQNTSASGGYGSDTLRLQKYDTLDSNTYNPLENALFGLYIDKLIVPSITPPLYYSGPSVIIKDGTFYYFIECAYTDSNGQITFTSQHILSDYMGAYALLEAQFPGGYNPAPSDFPPPPVDYADMLVTYTFNPALSWADNLIETDYIAIGNAPTVVDAQIQIFKSVYWNGPTPEWGTTKDFKIKVESCLADGTVIDSGPFKYSDIKTLTKDMGFTSNDIMFTIPIYCNHIYYFKISEIDESDIYPDWYYDDAYYMVKMVCENPYYDVETLYAYRYANTYPFGIEDRNYIVNTYGGILGLWFCNTYTQSGTPKLPETGGGQNVQLMFEGLALITVAGISHAIWKRKKQHN